MRAALRRGIINQIITIYIYKKGAITMKKTWTEPELEVLRIDMTAKDLYPGTEEDELSWTKGFPAWDCDCGS